MIPTGKTLNLCLNGKELKNTANNQRVIDVQGGTLNLTDCGSTGTITGGKFNSGNYSDVTGIGVRVKDNGTFNMYGGTISGNKNAEALGHSAGAVSVGYEFYGSEISIGTFNMYGGTISGNASHACGGVYVNRGSFTMYGGTISNNTVRYGGGVLFSYDKTELICYPAAKIGEKYLLSTNVKKIAPYAFYGVINLKAILYQGSAAKYQSIEIGIENQTFTSLPVTCNYKGAK